MKRTMIAIFIITSIFIPGTFLFAADNPADVKNTSVSMALITAFSGAAKIKPAGSAGFRDVELYMTISRGDELTTDKNSFIELTFDDASIIRLDENASLVISELKRENGIAKSIFKLAVGKLLAIVDKLTNKDSVFEVHTKMAIAAVKGTELGIDASGAGSILGVFDGVVNFTDLSGANGVDVGAGNESAAGGDGRPGTPGSLRQLAGMRDSIGGLRETINNIRRMKQDGTLEQYRQQHGQSGGQKVDAGSAGDNIDEVESRLKERLRDNLNNERRHAWHDLQYVNSQMQADFHLGKTMMDVHGNRVRVEEYVFRPVNTVLGAGSQELHNEIDTLSLTFRDNRLDYLRVQNIFFSELPETIPASYWNNIWYVADYPTGPENFRTRQVQTYSNTSDTLVIDNQFMMLQPSAWSAIPDPAFVLVKNYHSLSLNDSIKEERLFYQTNMFDANMSYQTVPGPNDKTNPLDAACPYTETKVSQGSDIYDTSITKQYNDGSTLTMNYYFINDYGESMTYPQTLSDLVDLAINTNIEIEVSSSEFHAGTIDIVSKLLWLSLLHPAPADSREDPLLNVP